MAPIGTGRGPMKKEAGPISPTWNMGPVNARLPASEREQKGGPIAAARRARHARSLMVRLPVFLCRRVRLRCPQVPALQGGEWRQGAMAGIRLSCDPRVESSHLGRVKAHEDARATPCRDRAAASPLLPDIRNQIVHELWITGNCRASDDAETPQALTATKPKETEFNQPG
jgi:hypothetical protein